MNQEKRIIYICIERVNVTMRKRLLGLSLVFIMLFIAGCSSTNHEPVESEGAFEEENEQETSETSLDYEGEGGFLWEIVHGETTMYVQGTIHLGHEDFYPLASEIEEAYESSDVVLPEINMFEADVNEEDISEMALFKEGTTLADVLSEESYAELSDIFEQNKMAVKDYNHFQPWFVESLLGQISSEESELAPEYGVDLYFLKRSLEDDKEIVELETVEGQYDMLSNFSMETQVKMLEGTIEEHDQVVNSLNQLGYNWIHGEKDAFIDQLSEGFEEMGEEYQQEMNDNRNLNMASKLDEILQKDDGQTYFVIIGSAHVLIDPSVPSELEEKGYEIERIY